MKRTLPALHILLLLAGLSLRPAFAEDNRQLAPLTPAAQETLRQEMLDNLMAFNEILTLLAENKVKEAGQVAEIRLGKSAMGKNARLPFDARPGPQMPAAMHELGRNGHAVASEFAQIASSGNQQAALEKLPALLNTCIGCHAAYRTR
ncbi:MAG: cytochrome C [Rhodocyclaceae bacterium]|nr:cytochrome C [Rhodocyclaceae bacterium]MDZ4216291.1 cytochrome C [Rhodocyclaceae bacterium]